MAQRSLLLRSVWQFCHKPYNHIPYPNSSVPFFFKSDFQISYQAYFLRKVFGNFRSQCLYWVRIWRQVRLFWSQRCITRPLQMAQERTGRRAGGARTAVRSWIQGGRDYQNQHENYCKLKGLCIYIWDKVWMGPGHAKSPKRKALAIAWWCSIWRAKKVLVGTFCINSFTHLSYGPPWPRLCASANVRPGTIPDVCGYSLMQP